MFDLPEYLFALYIEPFFPSYLRFFKSNPSTITFHNHFPA